MFAPGTRVQTPVKADGSSDGTGTIYGKEMVVGTGHHTRFHHVRLDKPGLPVRIYTTLSLTALSE